MSAVRRKLNSQAGVAMVVALVFFLLCVMVGVVIVTAATVSAGSVALERQTWRETEALTSAAQMLADDVTAMKFTGAYTKTEVVTTTATKTDAGDDTYTTAVSEDTTTYTAIGAGQPIGDTTTGDTKTVGLAGSTFLEDQFTKLNNLYLNKKKQVLPTGISWTSDIAVYTYLKDDFSVTLTFTASAGEEDEEDTTLDVPTVTCKLTMAEDYTITAVLTCEDGSSALTMIFEPQVSESTKTAKPTTEQDISASIVKKTTTTAYTTTITWGDPVVTKGATS